MITCDKCGDRATTETFRGKPVCLPCYQANLPLIQQHRAYQAIDLVREMAKLQCDLNNGRDHICATQVFDKHDWCLSCRARLYFDESVI